MTLSGPPPLQPPPLLLTKRLTSFLRSNLSAQLTSALLLTPSGKILSYASRLPVAVLRTHATVAASLWAIHAAGAARPVVDAALGRRRRGGGGGNGADGEDGDDGPAPATGPGGPGGYDGPVAVTVQLESGNTVVMRRLLCGILFVCFGPAAAAAADGHGQHEVNGHAHSHNASTAAPGATPTIGSPSEAGSVLSAATGVATLGSTATAATTASSTAAAAAAATAGVVAMRRHVEELARWLDERLGMLSMPEEGIGVGA